MKTELAGSRIRLDPRRVVHRANVRERKLENKENEQECSKGGKRIKVSNVWLPSKVGVAENSSIIGLAILNEDLHSQVAYQKML